MMMMIPCNTITFSHFHSVLFLPDTMMMMMMLLMMLIQPRIEPFKLLRAIVQPDVNYIVQGGLSLRYFYRPPKDSYTNPEEPVIHSSRLKSNDVEFMFL